MKAVTVKQLKDELKHRSQVDMMELCLKLARFKKENKELLTYLLFEADDEDSYVQSVKDLVDDLFDQINTKSFFYIRKSIRKILSLTKKYIRYSKKKETEVELLLHFCKRLIDFKPSISRSPRLTNVYITQLRLAKKALTYLHEDLQYDYQLELNELIGNEDE